MVSVVMVEMETEMFANEETKQKFANQVLELLSKTQNGEEALSSLRTGLRFKGWKNFGRLSNFESLLEEAGFTICHWDSRGKDRKPSGSGLCRYTTVTL